MSDERIGWQAAARVAAVSGGVLLASALFAAAPGAAAETAAAVADAGVRVELNKLEANEAACRAYLVFENKAPSTFVSFKLDLVLFDPDGIIAGRLAVEGGPLPAGKTSVKLFDIQSLACDGIGRVLLNEVMACVDDAGDRSDCTALVETASRTAVPFVE